MFSRHGSLGPFLSILVQDFMKLVGELRGPDCC